MLEDTVTLQVYPAISLPYVSRMALLGSQCAMELDANLLTLHPALVTGHHRRTDYLQKIYTYGN